MQPIKNMNNEPIAVVGIGCRFPGHSNSPKELWNQLYHGKSAISDVPPERWNHNNYYHPSQGINGRTVAKKAGFIEHIDCFDHGFFNISPREACQIDPQHRILLEVTWEAIEDSGIGVKDLHKSNTSVFIGISTHEYGLIQSCHTMGTHSVSGQAHCMAANRISYAFNLTGPSVAVDTACSSSLVAVHLACNSLWSGECTAAIAGGVNIFITPDTFAGFTGLSMLSPDSRCYAFDSRANGFVRGEGAGIVILKPLSLAKRDHDHIYSLILSTGSNQDGHSEALMYPSLSGQEELLRDVYSRSGIYPGEVRYVEAHGTGTQAGDPIEAMALGNILGQDSNRAEPLIIGSIKTNIGHLEAGAGIAGLIKACLITKNRIIPKSLNYENPNPNISFDEINVNVAIENLFIKDDGPLYVGVNSFGFGGANAHVVLSDYNQPKELGRKKSDQRHYILPLSAPSPEALNDVVSSTIDFLTSISCEEDQSLSNICYTASVRRYHHPYRLTVTGTSSVEMCQELKLLRVNNSFNTLPNSVSHTPDVVFLFTGQGSQWWGMARELLKHEPTFRQMLIQCDRLLHDLSGWSLLNELSRNQESSRMTQTAFAQPALFSVQAALVSLWKSWGVEPAAVVGHSVGEIAAAYAAGVLDLESAIRVAFHRGRVMDRECSRGAMLAVAMPLNEIEKIVQETSGQIEIAAVNGPYSITVSGDKDSIRRLRTQLEKNQIRVKELDVEYAFHSSKMEPVKSELLASLEDINPRRARIELFSSVTGDTSLGPEWDSSYWWRNLRDRVSFSSSINKIIDRGYSVFLELGPHPSLQGPVRECLVQRGKKGHVLASLRKGHHDLAVIYGALNSLYREGAELNWKGIYPEGKIVSLPSYPWRRIKCWIEDENHVRDRFLDRDHPLLGKRLLTAWPTWLVSVSYQETPYLKDHVFQKVPVFPASGYVEMVLSAGLRLNCDHAVELQDIQFDNPYFIQEKANYFLELRCSPNQGEFGIYGRQKDMDSWVRHAYGRMISYPIDKERLTSICPSAIKNRLSSLYTKNDVYEEFKSVGLDYGDTFRGVDRIWRSDFEALGEINLDLLSELYIEDYNLHPAFLDSCFQVIIAAMPGFKEQEAKRNAFLPTSIEEFRYYRRSNGIAYSHVIIKSLNPELLKADINVLDEFGERIISIKGFRCQSVPQGQSNSEIDSILYKSEWISQELLVQDEAKQKVGCWLVFSNSGSEGESLQTELLNKGLKAIIVRSGNRYIEHKDGSFTLDTDSFDSYINLFNAIHADPDFKLTGIIYLWGINATPTAALNEHKLDYYELNVDIPLFWIINVLQRYDIHDCRIGIITQFAQRISTDDPSAMSISQATLWGIRRVIANEYPNLKSFIVDIGRLQEDISNLAQEILVHIDEDEVIIRGNARLVHRYVRTTVREQLTGKTEHIKTSAIAFQARSLKLGLLENLKITSSHLIEPGEDEVSIEVRSAGLNFSDVLKAHGLYPEVTTSDATFGGECAGIVRAIGSSSGKILKNLHIGQRVIALAQNCFASHVTAPAPYVFPIPQNMSFNDAAAIPIVFLTAQYALIELGQLKRGEKVLIHAASGGVGLAAIQIARHLGAEIYATAGNEEKRAYLRSIGVSHIMDSRSLTFADEILRITDGLGIDMVLNSLSGEAIAKGISILKPFGRFIEIGKRDIYSDAKLGMRVLRNNISFSAVDLEQAIKINPSMVTKVFQDVIEGFMAGYLSAIPVKSFPINKIQDAFRFMSKALHLGKVVLNNDIPFIEVELPPEPITVKPSATYLIIGGAGGLGAEFAHWLQKKGATEIVFISRNAVKSQAAQDIKKELQDHYCSVNCFNADVGDRKQLKSVLQHINASFPPIKGIIHAAMIIQDATIANIDRATHMAVTRPKRLGLWNLHELTLNYKIDFFLMLSSVSTILGSPGQASYAGANSFVDALAHYRRGIGLSALSVNLGSIADIGYVSRNKELIKYLSAIGIPPLNPSVIMDSLEEILAFDVPQIGIARIEINRLAVINGLHKQARFNGLLQSSGQGIGLGEDKFLLKRIQAAPIDSRFDIFLAMLCEQIKKIINLDESTIDIEVPISDLGFDSLMTYELISWIDQSFGLRVSPADFNLNPSTKELACILLKRIEELESNNSLGGLGSRALIDNSSEKTTSFKLDFDVSSDRLANNDCISVDFLNIETSMPVDSLIEAIVTCLDITDSRYYSTKELTCVALFEDDIEIWISHSSLSIPNQIGAIVIQGRNAANWRRLSNIDQDAVEFISKVFVKITSGSVRHLKTYFNGGQYINRGVVFDQRAMKYDYPKETYNADSYFPSWVHKTDDPCLFNNHTAALDFVFVVHPRNRSDLVRMFPEAAAFPETLIQQLAASYHTYVSSSVECEIGGRSLKGEILSLPFAPQQLFEQPEAARTALRYTMEYAKFRSTRVLGLGALLPAISRYGSILMEYSGNVGITTGHGFTALTVAAYVRIIKKARMDDRPVAVVGAAGSTGRAVVRCLLKDNPEQELILIDLPQQLAKIRKISAINSSIHRISDDHRHIRDSGIVITMTNAHCAILSENDFGYNAVILDDAQPENVSSDIIEKRPDLTVIKCLALVPGLRCPFDFNFFKEMPRESLKEITFTCMAETILLAASGHQGHFTILDPTDEQFDKLNEWANLFGVVPSPPVSFPEIGTIQL